MEGSQRGISILDAMSRPFKLFRGDDPHYALMDSEEAQVLIGVQTLKWCVVAVSSIWHRGYKTLSKQKSSLSDSLVKAGCVNDPATANVSLFCCELWFPDGYPRDEIIYKWSQKSVATSDQKYWRLYQFDFMGLRNTTDMLTTTAGRRKVGGSTFGGVRVILK